MTIIRTYSFPGRSAESGENGYQSFGLGGAAKRFRILYVGFNA